MANEAACAIFIAATGILLCFLFTCIPFGSGRWTRDDPIPHAILPQTVTNGQIVLFNGNRSAPAGVRRHPDITESDYDAGGGGCVNREDRPRDPLKWGQSI